MDDALPPPPSLAPPVVLASGSPSRQAMLSAAGVPFMVDVPRVDEESIKLSLKAEGATPDAVAEVLAEMKAAQVARRHPGALVLGADQMLSCDGRWFDKPNDAAGVRDTLTALRGRTHRLHTVAVIMRDGQRIWHHGAVADLTMRPFSDAFLAAYMAAVGEKAYTSVGAYQVEGLGAQAFSRISGDWHVILGLPLLPLLDFLRAHAVVIE